MPEGENLETKIGEQDPFDELFDKVKACCADEGVLIFDLYLTEGGAVAEIMLDEHITDELERALKQLGVEVVRI